MTILSVPTSELGPVMVAVAAIACVFIAGIAVWFANKLMKRVSVIEQSTSQLKEIVSTVNDTHKKVVELHKDVVLAEKNVSRNLEKSEGILGRLSALAEGHQDLIDSKAQQAEIWYQYVSEKRANIDKQMREWEVDISKRQSEITETLDNMGQGTVKATTRFMELNLSINKLSRKLDEMKYRIEQAKKESND